jgi:hypothetical protein
LRASAPLAFALQQEENPRGKALVVGFHFTFPSIGHVEKDGAKYRLVPIAWNPVI